MPRLFISYARCDAMQIDRLSARLDVAGYAVSVDRDIITAGDPWRNRIVEAIDEADIVLVALSSASVVSEHVRREVEIAQEQHAPIVPVMIEPVAALGGLRWHLIGLQQVDLTTNFDAGMTCLLQELGSIARRAGIEPDANDPEPKQRNGDPVSHTSKVFRHIDESWCPEMLVVPAGRFLMGSAESEAGREPNEGPQHEVALASSFALGRYPVTFEEYDHFCQQTERELPGDESWGRQRRPVIKVSWNDAHAYAAWLSEVTRQRYRLPSEAEWEYACRAGTTTLFSTGTDHANDKSNDMSGRTGSYRKQTTPVGEFPANQWGLHDMLGNVWEWVQDVWRDDYIGAPSDGSFCLMGDDPKPRVLRGASWFDCQRNARAAKRYWRPRWEATNKIGFRVACSL